MSLDSSVALATDGESCAYRKAGVDCDSCKVRAISVCSALRPDERTQLEDIAQRSSFGAKETIFLEGDKAGSFFNITSGAVRLYRLFRDGRRQVLGFMLPGDFLGLELGDRRGVCAETVEATTACRFGRAQFTAMVADKPHLLQKLHERTGREINLAHDHMMALGQRSAKERIAWFLLSLHERQGQSCADTTTVKIAMPRQDIADFLGLTIETVSRTLTLLARENVIAILPKGIRLLDERRLAKLALS